MENRLNKRIELWKKNLLDLSRRNPLIAFKSPKRTSIRVVDELPTEVFQQLIIEEQKFEFLPKEEANLNETNLVFQNPVSEDLISENTIDNVDHVESEFFKYTRHDLDDKHTDTFLQTQLSESDLFKNLRSINSKAKLIIDEQGYNNLFLTLGMLEWYESDSSDKKNRSPLILVPVELTKKSIKSPFGLKRSDDDPLMNMSLQQKFKEDFNIEIPDIEIDKEFDPQEYLQSIQELIAPYSRWKVKNDIYLGFFSFASFVMYKDLEKYSNAYKNNKIIQLMSGVQEAFEDVSYPDAIGGKELDSKRHPKEIYHVMDADSSQDESIEIVKTGRNMIIKGPPGTGKSQTITNIVADTLGRGKSVLFVSEKMAALEVVYSRLKSVGLGPFCLELHSRKANKKHVLEQIKEAYEFELTKSPKETYLEELREKRDKLNEYSEFLHSPFEQINNSIYWLIGQLNSLIDVEILDFEFDKIDNLTIDEFNNIVNIIITLSDRIKQIGTPSKHPYWGTKINDTSQQHQQDFLKHLSSFKGLLKTCIEEMNKIENLTSLKIDTVSKAVQYCNLFDTLLKSHEVPLRLLTIENINNYRNELKPIFDSINSINDTKKDILINYELEILNEDLNKLRRNLKGEYSSILRIFKPQYYKDINFIKGFANKEISPFSYDEIVLDINSLISYKKLNEDINNIDKSIIEPIGDLWKSTETNVEFITNALNWLDEYNSNKISDDDDSHLKEWIRNSENISDELVDLKTKLEKTTTQAIKDKITIENDLKIDPTIIYENDFENTNLDQLLTCLKRWEDGIDNLVDWVRYRRAYEKCESVGIGKYVDEELEKSDDTSSILDKYKKKYFYGIFENLKQKHPILKDFESLIQEKLVSEFKELDKNHIQLSKYRIQKILRENRPDTNYQGTTAGELGTIQKQMRLKRGHMALRKLFNRASNVMQKINPCFMMSPMSVSQYLDPDKLSFDLVVFDEASQIKPEHSIGSIIRGKQLIVVGDEKQLPPTSFFSKELETDDDDEVTLPSILDECLTLSCFNESHLRWHYRSRDESLIQFSNLKFYNNKLYTFPSQSRTSDHTGIQFNYIEDSVYDRGGKQTNRQEADAIVDSLFEHFDTNPQLSIGIVALSSNQRRLISDILYERVYNNPKYDKFVNNSTLEEPLFIKNLETVQGDERDIIYISIGYGKDENGRLYMNFGPLNKDGGERRLNVLITRAKRKIVVFSSIKGSDFNLTQSSGVGITRLKEYLEFAESSGTKDLRSAHDISGELDMDNPFETSVAEQLTQANIKFIPQVGQSGYKIDFGIIDPSDSSKFILALECDGATYHSSHTARDRDRLRQSVLEGLGWNFHRVWSTDWFQNPAREMQRLKESIQNAKSGNTKVDVSKNKIEFDDIEIISKNISEIQIIDYKKVHIDHFSMMDQEHFYQLGDSRSTENIEYFNNIILSILKIESPMHKDELSLRVIEHFDMRTVGSRIRKIMATKTSRLKAHKKIITKSDFIYQIDQEIDFVRKQDGRDALSNITRVSPEEIQNAITYIIDNEFEVPKDALISQVSRLLGYKSTGPRIQNYISDIINISMDDLIEIKNEDGIVLKN